VIITRSNKRANDFNEQIRRRILWREEEIDAGDRLMVVRNNYHWLKENDAYPTDLIANGDTLVVQKIVRRFERYGLRYATADLKMEDFPDAPSFEAAIMLDALHVDGPSLPGARMKTLFEDVMLDYSHLGSKRKIAQAAKQDPCTQALQVKFAYAVTAHKSQGGQWPAIVVDQGYLTEEMVDLEWLRWLYTALTRAQEEAHLLNFHPRFLASPTDE
jgi:exodeoxyribonuclease-5